MAETILTRRLWYVDALDTVSVEQSFLQTDKRSLVVLGEAGMGKSTLLEQLKPLPGYVVCTARRLINAANPASVLGDATTLVIDALDEVAARRDGDAVDAILQKLDLIGNPRFILSCRVADWRSATALQGIKDLYDEAPLELHLDPLERADARQFLAETLGEERADETLGHLEERGLSGLWANPQTLILVETVARQGSLPFSKGELFADATRLMLREHREEKAETPLAEMPEAEVLDAAGAAFAALILTGKAALSRLCHPADTDLAMRDAATLPGAARVGDILASRLFMAKEPERFGYAHRAIGEFLGARWLAKTADTPRKRRRLLRLFTHQSLVPASLRGLHAWLAWHGPSLAIDVIETDPMGVIEYGDADRLTPSEGRAMFAALNLLSRENPRFRAWSRYRLAGLVQKDLLPDIVEVLTGPDVEFGLRLLVLQALEGSALVSELSEILTAMVVDPAAAFATRSEAAERLAALEAQPDWSEIIDQLGAENTANSVRLASELMDEVGFDRFSDPQILAVALAMMSQSDRTVGVYAGLQRNLPDGRIDALLSGIASATIALEDRRAHPGYSAITDLAFGLFARRLTLGGLDAETVWTWMRPFDSGGSMYRQSRKTVADVLASDTALRQAIQRHVLLDQPGEKNVWQRAWRLNERSVGLNPTEDDILALLEALSDDDPRWRDVVRLAAHSDEQGEAVRVAAGRFIVGDRDAQAWLAKLPHPDVPEWELKEQARRRAREKKRNAEWARHRADFAKGIEGLRKGDYGLTLGPAKAYLKLFYDMGDEASDGPGRLEEWLGPEIRDACLEGFEAFLQTSPPKPTATEIATSYAENRRWEAGYIITAALGERQRTGRGFDDLSDERLMAGLFEVRHTRVDDHAGLKGLDVDLVAAVRRRGIWEAAQRLYFEMQISKGRQHVDGLYAFMRDAPDAPLATALAIEWLHRFPAMTSETELELVDHLLSTPSGRVALSPLVPLRLGLLGLDPERRKTWEAIGLILRFEETRAILEASGAVTPDHFWHLRARLRNDRDGRPLPRLAATQLAWMVNTFRVLLPLKRRPEGVTSGDDNDWDASEFIIALISRLGDDVSPEAMGALTALREAAADGYTETLQVVAAEQRRKRVEADWSPPDLSAVATTVTDASPTTAPQLQAILLEELEVIQAQLKGSDVDWYKDFYDGAVPRKEDDCRDSVLKMLRPLPFDIQAAPEGHLADDKRADILCTLGDLMVPIEVKGQWHPELWGAADRQLDQLYVNDWRAERGIYLVLWFGPGASKRLKKPPLGVVPPRTPESLQVALTAESPTAREGRNQVVVLDLTRPG